MANYRIPTVNWSQLALNLRNYKSTPKVAEELDCDERTLRRIASGDIKDPKWELGIKLLNLHFDQFPDKHRALLNTTGDAL